MNSGQKSSKVDREHLLLRSIAAGDRDAFAELFDAYHEKLFRFIYRLTHSYTTSEELVNDIMLLVWRKASTFRGESKVSTWIFGIAYRQSMKRLSKDRRLASRTTELTDTIAAKSDSPVTEDWVRQGLDALPAAQQVTAMLVFYLGLSYEEVSKATDCPVSTVKTRMFHVRRKLKDILPAIAEPAASAGRRAPDEGR